MKKFFAFVLLLAFLIPQVASSEEGSGYYGSVTGGLLFTNDMNLPDSLNSRDSFEADFTAYNNFNNATGQFGTGSFGAIAIGKKWGSFLRTEFEYGFRNAAFSSVDGIVSAYQKETPLPGDDDARKLRIAERTALVLEHGGIENNINESAIGNISIHSLMANLFLDYSNKTKLTPYFGAGVGLAFWKYNYAVDGLATRDFPSIYGDTVRGTSTDHFFEFDQQPASNISEKDNGADFAYQLMAGVAFDVTENIKATGGYRLFRINNDHGFVAHSTEIGIRYSF